MKLVYLNPAGLLGGAERSLLDLLAAVRQQRPDAELTLIAGGEGPLVSRAEALGVRTILLPLPSALAGFGDSALSGQGRVTRWMSLAMRGGPAALAARAYARKLRGVIEPLDADLIHSNGLKTHVLARLTGLSTPVVWHLRDYVGRRPLMRRVLAWAAGRAALGIGISNSVSEDARAALPGLPIETVYNAIDVAHFTPGPGEGSWLDEMAGFASLPDQQSPVRIGIVAAYAHWKGQEVFLDAAAKCQAHREKDAGEIRFFVIGGPIYATQGSQWTEAELRARWAALGIDSQVGFVPFQDDVVRVYRSLDVVVHASTEPEPFGRTIVEAQACGRAVIAAQAGGAAELITNGVDALGTSPRDVTELAQAMARLADDPALRARLGEAGRRRVVECFARPRLGHEVLALYDRLLARRFSERQGASRR